MKANNVAASRAQAERNYKPSMSSTYLAVRVAELGRDHTSKYAGSVNAMK